MFIDALQGKNRKRPPIWLMRQAGRYMPSYQALRAKHSLRNLFLTPELAAEVTLMPVEQLGLDAAILFSDITVVALALGFELDFSEGPVIRGSFHKKDLQPLEPIERALHLIKPQLKVPLIGFCGGPFTVASYINNDPALLEPLTEVTIDYIHMQEKAGVDAIQIFESWADRLSDEEFKKYCAPYLKRLIEATNVPVILFMRGGAKRVELLVDLNPAAISFDHEVKLSDLRKKVPMAIQGNLDPDVLLQPLDMIQKEAKEILSSLKGDPGFIFNLGHGVKPNTPIDSVRCLIETVKNSVY